MRLIGLFIPLFFLMACQQVPLAMIPARNIEADRLTLGSVQARLKIGEPSSVVIDALGSPNIVTSNGDDTETWVYDKVSTEVEYAAAQGFFNQSGVASRSTRTMVVVVKFDKLKRIENVRYRQTTY